MNGRISISLGPDMGLGRHFRPGHGFVHVLDVPDREARDQVAGLGERPVGDRAVGAIDGDALGLGGGGEAGGGDEDLWP